MQTFHALRRSLFDRLSLLYNGKRDDDTPATPGEEKGVLLEWDDSFKVGETQVDLHHQHLVALIQQLQKGVQENMGRESVDRILRELAAYIHNHFAYEEELMARFEYPGTRQHKEEHAKFIANVGAFFTAFQEGKANLTLEVLQFLTNWLTTHIRREDKILGAHVIRVSARQRT